MADALALLAAVAIAAVAVTAAVLLAARRRAALAAARERERLEAPERTERYIDAVNAAPTTADLDALAREFGIQDRRRAPRRASSTDKRTTP